MQNERQRDNPGNVGSDDRQQHGYPCTTRSRQPHSIPPTDHIYDEVILSMDSVRTQLGEVSTTTGRRGYCPRNINVDPREGRPYHVKVSLILIQTRRHPLSRPPYLSSGTPNACNVFKPPHQYPDAPYGYVTTAQPKIRPQSCVGTGGWQGAVADLSARGWVHRRGGGQGDGGRG